MEYLKNVVVRFMQAGDEEQEQLVTVLATLLHFSADELSNIRQARQPSSPVKVWHKSFRGSGRVAVVVSSFLSECA